MKINFKIILINSLAIALFLSIPIISSPDFDYTLKVFGVEPFQKVLLAYILVVIFFYAHYFILLPKFFQQKKYFSYGLSLLLGLLAISSVELISFHPHDFSTKHVHHHDFGKFKDQNRIGMSIISSIVPYAFAIMTSFILYLNKKSQKIELDKYQTEVKNLKYQLQPHFLFNSLNNIYSLSITNPDKTPYYIQKLSEILRFLLLSNNAEKVSLKDDLQFCRQFIDLQKLRYDERVEKWEIIFNEVDHKYFISPFLLIPLIENVFKYGVLPDQPSPIYIEIGMKDNVFFLKTKNSKHNIMNSNLLSSQKLGLSKTKERLNLLYPSKHTIKVVETDDDYELELNIQLSE